MRAAGRAVIGCFVLLGLSGCGARSQKETSSEGGANGAGIREDPLTATPVATDRNLEILDYGRGERRIVELRYVEGCQNHIVVTKESAEQTTANGALQENKTNTERMTAHNRALSVTPDGDFVIEVTIDKEIPLPGQEAVPLSSDTPGDLPPEEQSRLEEVPRRKSWKPVVTMTTARNGTVKDFQMNVPVEFPPAAKEMLTKMLSGIVGAKLEGFPSMPVGIGAKWRNDMTIDFHVFHVEGKNVCELTGHTDEYVQLKCSSKLIIPEQRMDLPGELSAVKPLATGTIDMETEERTWLSCPGNSGTRSTKTRLDMEVTAPNGTVVNVTVESTEVQRTELQTVEEP